MSGRFRNILLSCLASPLAFLVMLYAFDRDIARYPFVMRSAGYEQEKAIILDTLRQYNKILSDFYASGGLPAMLNDFPATKLVRHWTFRDLGFIRDTGRVLVYDMADMMPVEVHVTSFNTAEAVVYEEWNYIYQRISDRIPISRLKGLGVGFRYSLVRQKGAWVVSNWEPVEVEGPSPDEKGFVF